MLLSKKHTLSGFSLVEAMVSTMIIGVAFAGVYTITIYSTNTLNASADRQNLQLVANQMVEIIESDRANIDFYDMSFTTCNAPDSAETEDYHQYRYRWCRMLNDYVGAAATGDVREIAASDTADGKLVNIILENRNAETKVVMKRLFNE